MATATGRLDLRLNPEDKRYLTRAAEIRGEPVSTFVRSVALCEARRVLVEHGSVVLSGAEGRRLIDALGKPFRPNAGLRKALARGDELGL